MWPQATQHNLAHVLGVGDLCFRRNKTVLSSITNKMQHYTIFFITVNALHVSGSFSTHHQGLKTVHTASGICQA